MIKLWPSSPAALETPKAGPDGRERVNPFDLPSSPSTTTTINSNSSATATTAPTHSLQPPTTPTAASSPGGFYHHHLLSRSPGGHMAPPAGQGAATSAADLTPLGGAQPMGSATAASFASALPTTSLSLHAPEFSMKQPPTTRPKHPAPSTNGTTTTTTTAPSGLSSTAPRTASSNGAGPSALTANRHPSSASSAVAANRTSAPGTSPPQNAPGRQPKGQIHVKLLSARGLNVQTPRARPYVVVEFEQNEFVSRDPIGEAEKEIRGAPTTLQQQGAAPPLSRAGSSNALSALGAINSKALAIDAARSGSKPGSKPGSNPSSAGTKGHLASLVAAATNGRHREATSSQRAPSPTVTTSANSLFGQPPAHNPVWKHEVTFDVTTDQSEITFTVYDRASEDHFFLGTVQIKPVLKHDHTVDQWYKLQSLQEGAVVSGEMRVQITFEQSKSRRALTPRDFEFLKLIGRGTFGRVFQVRKKDTKRIYAMKVLSKKEIVAKKEVAHTIGERKILQRSLESPFLVGLKFSFQTDTDLYLVTDFKSGGELFWHLQRETRFSEDRARFYIAELILALEHLHKYNIVYRDLKPENILLDATGHVALCDFGLSKADLRPDELTQTFCGTTEYLAPEVLLDEHGYSKLVDFWSLGVLLFEMCCGWSPFYAEDTQQMYRNICFGKIRFPKGVINDDGKQFVKGLLNRNPKHRLGAQRDTEELKEHAFFGPIDWHKLALKQVEPPFKPSVESDESVANFDTEFTNADLTQMGVPLDEFDEDDPSEAWTATPASLLSPHTPNGPLGSDNPLASLSRALPSPLATGVLPTSAAAGVAPSSAATSSTARNSASTTASSSNANGIAIASKKKKGHGADAAHSPISHSMQENFKGFTFSGGESLVVPASLAQRMAVNDQSPDAIDLDEEEPTTEDEVEDDGVAGGRYARRRRNGDDEDMMDM